MTRLDWLGVWLAAAMLACGGAEIGEACDEVGSGDECVDGALCTNGGEGATCRQTCEEQEQCPEGHDCNGVSGTSTKTCQPKGDNK